MWHKTKTEHFVFEICLNVTSDLLTPLLHLVETLQMFRPDHCEPNQYWMNSTRHTMLKAARSYARKSRTFGQRETFEWAFSVTQIRRTGRFVLLAVKTKWQVVGNLKDITTHQSLFAAWMSIHGLSELLLDVKRGLRENLFFFLGTPLTSPITQMNGYLLGGKPGLAGPC